MISIRNKDYNVSHTLANLVSHITSRNILKLYMYSRLCGLAMLCLELDARSSSADHTTEDTGFSKAEYNYFRNKQGIEPGSRPPARKDQPAPRPQQHHHTVIEITATISMHGRG